MFLSHSGVGGSIVWISNWVLGLHFLSGFLVGSDFEEMICCVGTLFHAGFLGFYGG